MKYAVSLFLSLYVVLFTIPVYCSASTANADEGTQTWQLAQSNPVEIMRRTLRNEIAGSYGNRSPLRYRLRKVSNDSNTVKQIVETPEGGVARLLEADGRSLSSSQEKGEIERLKALNSDPSMEAHRRRNEDRDAERMRKFMRLLPEAFLYRFAGSVDGVDGQLIRLTFEPNPKFSPPDFETRILTGIHGEIWIEPDDLRVVHLVGKTFRSVDFGWGIIGTLYPGATMLIEQTKTDTCGWQLSHLKLHLLGKELMFKSLRIEVEETATNYQWVPKNWTYHDAVNWLLQMPLTAEISDNS